MFTIAFDIHGTIDRNPEVFKPMMKLLVESRVNVWVMSGPPKEKIEDKLDKLGYYSDIHYHGILSIVDFLKERDVKMWQDEDNNWWSDDKSWWSAKGNMCKNHMINSLVDNEIRYKTFMPEGCKFILWEGV